MIESSLVWVAMGSFRVVTDCDPSHSSGCSAYHCYRGVQCVSLLPWGAVRITVTVGCSAYHCYRGVRCVSLLPWGAVRITVTVMLHIPQNAVNSVMPQDFSSMPAPTSGRYMCVVHGVCVCGGGGGDDHE